MKWRCQYFHEALKAIHPDLCFSTVSHIRRQVEEWAAYSHVKSLLNINEIKDSIDAFYRDIDGCFIKFNVRLLLCHQKIPSLNQSNNNNNNNHHHRTRPLVITPNFLYISLTYNLSYNLLTSTFAY